MHWLNKFFRRKRTQSETAILTAILTGHTLRSHRDIDGNKYFYLHALDGTKEAVDGTAVHRLRQQRLIETNHKFPSATFLLTDHGRQRAQRAAGHNGSNPISAHNFTQKKQ